MQTARARAEHLLALSALFERTGDPCFCRYWHFTGDKNAWQLRCAVTPRDNRAELERSLSADLPPGIVAMRGDRAVGWMKVCPALAVPKLYDQRLYRGLPCFSGDRSGVWTVGCFLVEPSERRRGVARAMLSAGIELARACGATSIEAMPFVKRDAPAEQLNMGPEQLYLDAGFETVHALGPYAVLRRTL